MLHTLRNYYEVHYKFMSCLRHLTTTEVSTALRPFYFNVHPDLFGQYPNQRITNENSLKHLSSIIEMLQAKRWIKPTSLQFYLRDKKCKEGSFRLIKIYINERDIREVVLTILKSCELSTEYVDKIPKPPKPKETIRVNSSNIDFSKVNENDPVFGPIIMRQKMSDAKEALKLRNWLARNYKSALEKSEANRPLREEVDRLRKEIAKQWKLTDVRWDCGWNVTHFRGCLQSFMSLAEQHPEVMHVLKRRTLVFAPFTGISLEGHIMLNSGEVRHNWLDLIKNVRKYDQVLFRIPGFEKSVSQVLRGIKVGRRKFMPKILAGEYERNLQQITTSLSDYRGRRGFPQQWPQSLEDYEIVVETEAGPLMVSPTGQFIVPSSLPGFLLVNFITKNLQEAKDKMINYKNNKHIERSLQKQCTDEFLLYDLRKDDNVTPDLMIQCCEQLLEKKDDLRQFLQDQKLLNHIAASTGVKISPDDGFPQNACSFCLKKLEFSLDFAQQVKNSDTFLKTCLKENLSQNDDKTDNARPPQLDSDKSCHTCKKTFDTKNQLRRHTKIHTNVKSHVCDKCGKTYKESGSLNKHIVAQHSGQEKPYKCSECLQAFNLRSTLIRHLRTHSGEKPFGCEVCHKFYPSKSYLNRHKKIHTKTRDRPFVCEICSKSFLLKDSLKAHLIVHSAEKPYNCDLCDKTFSTKGSLKSHIQYIHTKEKNFMCQICAKKFMSKSDLCGHIRKHTGEEKHHTYQCNTCFKKLSSSTHLKVHIRAEHTGEKPYKCDFCPKAFITKQALKIHRRYHTGERPFKCSFCSKCFVTNGGKKVHERVHTGERPYGCTTCGDTFSQSSSLKTHMKSH